jgi:hypothetical protein
VGTGSYDLRNQVLTQDSKTLDWQQSTAAPDVWDKATAAKPPINLSRTFLFLQVLQAK